MDQLSLAAAKVRLLRYLSYGPARLTQAQCASRNSNNTLLLNNGKNHPLSCSPEMLRGLQADELIVRGSQSIKLSRSGLAHLKRALSAVDEFQNQHRSTRRIEIEHASGKITVTKNEAESPLARLRKPHGKGGAPYLNDSEYTAGERLRSDFTRAGLLQNISSNWSAMLKEPRTQGCQNGQSDMSDAAIDSGIRIERAITSVGPELSGVLLDICCFLKGFETVERERKWPPRSAKLMLKSGLSILARHYGMAQRGSKTTTSTLIRHWGSENYRPKLFPE